MKLNFEQLETKDNPSASFDFPANASLTPYVSGLEAYGAHEGGGPRVEVQYRGKVIFNQFAYEDTFRGGVSVQLRDVDGDRDFDLLVGAGVGGGPRVKTYRNDHNQFTLIRDEFVYAEGFRGGVNVEPDGGFTPHYADRDTYDLVYLDPLVKPRVLSGDYNPLIGRQLASVPDGIMKILIEKNVKVLSFGGRLTDIPEFAHLRGTRTPAEGDGERVFDAATAAALPKINTIFIGPGADTAVVHEIGHLVQYHVLTPKQDDEWFNVWVGSLLSNKLTSAYEMGSPQEGYAEAFRRWVFGIYNPPQIDSFFKRTLGEL